ncbi:MAG: hypothetical protein ACTSP3_03725 [Candidatus Heimdallarchaeaceae archaeon]
MIIMNVADDEKEEEQTNEEIEENLELTPEEELVELQLFGEKVKIISEFFKEQEINLSKWFEGIITRKQVEFESRLKSSKIQFGLTMIFLFLVSGGLLTALLMDKILAETFIGIIGIIIGYMFYMLKYSALAPIRQKEQT